jgi:hypothetical protein
MMIGYFTYLEILGQQ